jgi:hypothetical protein
LEKPEGATKMDNSETLAILDTQDTRQINVRENRNGDQELTIQRRKLATLDTQDTGQINVGENRRGDQELTIQRHSQCCLQFLLHPNTLLRQ